MAMVRTVFSPRCWATSRISRNSEPVRWSILVVSRAERMAGRWPSNSTSTTAPMTWLMRPLPAMVLGAAAVVALLAAGAFGAAAFLAAAGALAAAAFGAAALVAAGFLGAVAIVYF